MDRMSEVRFSRSFLTLLPRAKQTRFSGRVILMQLEKLRNRQLNAPYTHTRTVGLWSSFRTPMIDDHLLAHSVQYRHVMDGNSSMTNDRNHEGGGLGEESNEDMLYISFPNSSAGSTKPAEIPISLCVPRSGCSPSPKKKSKRDRSPVSSGVKVKEHLLTLATRAPDTARFHTLLSTVETVKPDASICDTQHPMRTSPTMGSGCTKNVGNTQNMDCQVTLGSGSAENIGKTQDMDWGSASLDSASATATTTAIATSSSSRYGSLQVMLLHPEYVDCSNVPDDATQNDVDIAIKSTREGINPNILAWSLEKDGVRKNACNKATFPTALFNILADPDLDEVMSWLPHGRSWRIVDTNKFNEQVLSSYFNQSKYTSFIRQVNAWGFRRVQGGPEGNTYYHELFLRGKPGLLKYMRREPASSCMNSAQRGKTESEGTHPNFYEIAKLHPLPLNRVGEKHKRRRDGDSSKSNDSIGSVFGSRKKSQSSTAAPYDAQRPIRSVCMGSGSAENIGKTQDMDWGSASLDSASASAAATATAIATSSSSRYGSLQVMLVHPEYVDCSNVPDDATQNDVDIAIKSTREGINPNILAWSLEKDGVRKNACNKATFPTALFNILADPDLDEVMSWLPHGRSWRIVDSNRFNEQVLSSYFNQSKYTSFIRQVNAWGFRRVQGGPEGNTYYHELFLRGKPGLLKYMRREPASSCMNSAQRGKTESEGTHPNFYEIAKLHPLPLNRVGEKHKRRRDGDSSKSNDSIGSVFGSRKKSHSSTAAPYDAQRPIRSVCMGSGSAENIGKTQDMDWGSASLDSASATATATATAIATSSSSRYGSLQVMLLHPEYVDCSHVSDDAMQNDVDIAIKSTREGIDPNTLAWSLEKDGVRKNACNKATFPTALFNILADPDLDEVISWLPHGRSWRIVDTNKFNEQVLSSYLNQSKYTSFIRQVNAWGFRQQKDGPGGNAYYHELFLRGKPGLLKYMRREPASSSMNSAQRGKTESEGTHPNFYEIARLHPLPPNSPRKAKQVLKREHVATKHKRRRTDSGKKSKSKSSIDADSSKRMHSHVHMQPFGYFQPYPFIYNRYPGTQPLPKI